MIACDDSISSDRIDEKKWVTKREMGDKTRNG